MSCNAGMDKLRDLSAPENESAATKLWESELASALETLATKRVSATAVTRESKRLKTLA